MGQWRHPLHYQGQRTPVERTGSADCSEHVNLLRVCISPITSSDGVWKQIANNLFSALAARGRCLGDIGPYSVPEEGAMGEAQAMAKIMPF